jgi:hypothetical protein
MPISQKRYEGVSLRLQCEALAMLEGDDFDDLHEEDEW